MKKNPHLKALIWLFALLFVVQTAPTAFAHNTSQEGILAKSYIGEGYQSYYIGGDRVGWSIDEKNHTNGSIMTYSFTEGDHLNNTIKNIVTQGAQKWSGTVSIIHKADGSGTGEIKAVCDYHDYKWAYFTDYSSNAKGHLYLWTIVVNVAHPVTAVTLAHEFGHAIGLNDLYGIESRNKLMYGYTSNRTATGPTAADKWGAKVITGSHTVHTWGGYTYHSTNASGNKHAKYCTLCNGISLQVEQCTYNANNVCTKCGIPKGVQPYSVDDPLVLES